MSIHVGFGIQLRKIQAFFLVKSVKFRCKIVFSAFESRSKRRLRQPSSPTSSPTSSRLGGLSAGRRDSWHRRQSKILEKHLVMPRYTRWAGHGVVSCVSLSSSFPARPSPIAFLVRPPCAFSDRPPAPTLCSSRSPPPTVAPSLRRSNHHVIQIWQARNSNLAGDDYRSGSPRRGLNAGTGPP